MSWQAFVNKGVGVMEISMGHIAMIPRHVGLMRLGVCGLGCSWRGSACMHALAIGACFSLEITWGV